MQVKNMKIETVIKLLEANKNHYENGSMAEALETAIKALEKQLPKKPIKYAGNCFDACPTCRASVGVNEFESYCSYCGQKLRWSLWKEEEE